MPASRTTLAIVLAWSAGAASPAFANMMGPSRLQLRFQVELSEASVQKMVPAMKAAAANRQTPPAAENIVEGYAAKVVVVCLERTKQEAAQCLVEFVAQEGGDVVRVSLEDDDGLALRTRLELWARWQGRSSAAALTSPANAWCVQGEEKMRCQVDLEPFKAKSQP